MSTVNSERDCELLLSANDQLEKMYYQEHDPCLALHISRNYHLLQKQDANNHHQQQWQEKAKTWWQLYWGERSNKSLGLFYDENDMFLDTA